MSLQIGQQLGSYEITSLLGAGGMGEVYRARDAKLKRDVAIKILPEEFSREADRLSRFQREAEIVAALNHPNIGTIYDIQEQNGTRFLVLELVEGETLAERTARSPIPVEEALNIAYQICEALEAAHEKGIVHRDLKPANVKIQRDGRVKVLDFGLAKAMENAPANTALSNSPTMLSGSMQGMVLGTAGYMSPEQARGRAADHRSDVFSFGCVLYEMLTGRRAFQGDDVSDTLASVLRSEPDWNLLPADLNPKLRDLLRRSLEKNPHMRWHAIADVRLEIEGAINDPRGLRLQTPVTTKRRPLWKRAMPVITAAVLTLVAAVIAWNFKPSPPMAITRFPFLLPDGQVWTNRGAHLVAISPDGANVVYAANDQLYLRSMAEMEARPIPGTGQTADTPFFSPDGRWLGFYASAERKLKKIAMTGGPAVTICDADAVYGASWSSDDTIFVGQGQKGIFRVSANGGKPEPVVSVKPGEIAHGPQLLPGGDYLLFTLAANGSATGWDQAQILVQSLKSGERKVLFEGGRDARYVPTGHILFASDTTLLAVAFDAKNLKVTSGPVPLLEGVRRPPAGSTAALQFSVAANGSMVYVPGGGAIRGSQRTLELVNHSGVRKALNIAAGFYDQPRISPNGKELAVHTDDGKERIVWIYDLAGITPIRRLTFGGANYRATWTLDGQRVVFTSDRDGDNGLFWQPADGNGPAELLAKSAPNMNLQSEAWSSDGKVLVLSVSRRGERSLSTLSVGTGETLKPLLPAYASNSSISPDGRWLAYTSNSFGRYDIYVVPFPPTGAKYQITTNGRDPLWSHDGKRLYYLESETAGTWRVVSVEVQTQPSFVFGKVTPLPINGIMAGGPRAYDITPDGTSFLVMIAKAESEKAPAEQINVVLNWFRELQERVPVK
jgi:eukaryotic-like serine/threonine-protein kinase